MKLLNDALTFYNSEMHNKVEVGTSLLTNYITEENIAPFDIISLVSFVALDIIANIKPNTNEVTNLLKGNIKPNNRILINFNFNDFQIRIGMDGDSNIKYISYPKTAYLAKVCESIRNMNVLPKYHESSYTLAQLVIFQANYKHIFVTNYNTVQKIIEYIIIKELIFYFPDIYIYWCEHKNISKHDGIFNYHFPFDNELYKIEKL